MAEVHAIDLSCPKCSHRFTAVRLFPNDNKNYAIWNRILTDKEVKQLLDNPYPVLFRQLKEPPDD